MCTFCAFQLHIHIVQVASAILWGWTLFACEVLVNILCKTRLIWSDLQNQS
jgi:hypothetical protein